MNSECDQLLLISCYFNDQWNQRVIDGLRVHANDPRSRALSMSMVNCAPLLCCSDISQHRLWFYGFSPEENGSQKWLNSRLNTSFPSKLPSSRGTPSLLRHFQISTNYLVGELTHCIPILSDILIISLVMYCFIIFHLWWSNPHTSKLRWIIRRSSKAMILAAIWVIFLLGCIVAPEQQLATFGKNLS